MVSDQKAEDRWGKGQRAEDRRQRIEGGKGTKAFLFVNDHVVFGLERERKGVMHMKMSKEEFVEKISKLELSEDRAISNLSEELQQYEKKYKLRSEIFYKLIAGTPAEDTPDFISWSMRYRSYFRMMQSKFSIEEVTAGAL